MHEDSNGFAYMGSSFIKKSQSMNLIGFKDTNKCTKIPAGAKKIEQEEASGKTDVPTSVESPKMAFNQRTGKFFTPKAQTMTKRSSTPTRKAKFNPETGEFEDHEDDRLNWGAKSKSTRKSGLKPDSKRDTNDPAYIRQMGLGQGQDNIIRKAKDKK